MLDASHVFHLQTALATAFQTNRSEIERLKHACKVRHETTASCVRPPTRREVAQGLEDVALALDFIQMR